MLVSLSRDPLKAHIELASCQLLEASMVQGARQEELLEAAQDHLAMASGLITDKDPYVVHEALNLLLNAFEKFDVAMVCTESS